MKTYKAILLSVLGLVIVVGGSYMYMRNHKTAPKEAVVKGSSVSYEGSVTRTFEGENKLVYSFDIPETATATVSMDGALVKVTNGVLPVVAMYMSYEGGRGYSSLDYISNNIIPKVSGVKTTGTTTIGGVLWTMAQSGTSEWYVGQVGDGQWLMVAEGKLANHDATVGLLESLKTK